MAAMEKNNKNLNVPNLRFPEFSGEWEKYSLGEIGHTSIGLTYSPADVVKEDGTIVLRSSNIQDGEIDYKDLVRVNKKIKDSLFTKKDDILICARNGSSRLIGKNALISNVDAGHSYGAFMMVYRSEDNRFIRQLLCTKRYFAQVGENLGARINQITTSDMNSFEFFFPQSKEERNKIALFLRIIDERISTQKKIIEDLKKLKDAIRTKLFRYIENTCTAYDEIRNMLDYEQPTEYLVNSTEYSDSYQTPVLTANKAFILGYTDELHGIYDKGDCIILDDFTMDVKYVTFPFKVKSSAIKILTAKQNVDLYYMYEYIMHLALVSEEHKRHYISEIEPMNITCPPLQEQKQISLMLKSLNMLVDNAKNYQGLLSKQKQYLLTQLFI